MMSVISVLVSILTLGFVGVMLVGFIGWRARMRRVDVDLENYSKAA